MACVDNLIYEEPIENPNEKAGSYMDYFFKYYHTTELFTIDSLIEVSDLPADKKRCATQS